MTLEKNSGIAMFALHISQLIIFTFAAILLLSGLLFLVGVTISVWTLPLSFAIAASLLCFCYSEKPGIKIALEISCLLAISFFAILVMGYILDFSWDGNAYHKMAVALLKRGWNPVTQLPESYLSDMGMLTKSSLWIESYCKVTWIFAAGLYAITGNIETGKVYTVLGMLCVFCLSYYYFKKKGMKDIKSIIISFCLASNPIAVSQMFTYYIDGFLQIILGVLVLSLLMLCDRVKFDYRVSVSLVAASMIVCGNIKFTGLLYGGIFCIAFYLRNCFVDLKTNKNRLKTCIKSGLRFALLAVVTVCVAGFTPYITNLMRHGSLTYPLTGEGKVDVISDNSPFARENHFKNLFESLFSKQGNITFASGQKVQLKIPFTVDWAYESQSINGYDNRLSGFGIFFSGALIIALAVLLVYFIAGKKDNRYALVAVTVITCIGLAFGIKESWWARYAPYIYFLPIAALSVLFLREKRLNTILGVILSLVLFVNNTIPLYGARVYYRDSKYVNAALDEMEKYETVEVATQFQGIYFDIMDRGIDIVINRDLLNQEDINYLGYRGTVWKADK